MTEFVAGYARGSIRRWPIAEDYAVDHGRLVERGEPSRRSDYMPVGHPELLLEFAKLLRDDAAALVDFARKRGLLGFPGESMPGDPQDWIWVHAEQVRAVINLLALRRGKKEEELVAAISGLVTKKVGDSTFVIEFILLNGDSRRVAQNFTYGGDHLHLVVPDLAEIGIRRTQSVSALPNINIPSVPHEFQKGHGKYLLLADVIAQEVVNRNMDCPSKIIMPEFGHLVRSYVYNNLMEVIYSHLADYASGDRVYVRCRFCGTYFHQKHGRQVFCPPDNTRTESLCAMRFRKAKWRNGIVSRSDSTKKTNGEKEGK